jgi:hypothetical protein
MWIEETKGMGMAVLLGPIDFILQKDEHLLVCVRSSAVSLRCVSHFINLLDFSGRNL